MFPVLGASPVMFQSPRNGLLCARTGAAAAKPAAAMATSRKFCSRKVTSRARTGRTIAGVRASAYRRPCPRITGPPIDPHPAGQRRCNLACRERGSVPPDASAGHVRRNHGDPGVLRALRLLAVVPPVRRRPAAPMVGGNEQVRPALVAGLALDPR